MESSILSEVHDASILSTITETSVDGTSVGAADQARRRRCAGTPEYTCQVRPAEKDRAID
jgi:hypothetical protein